MPVGVFDPRLFFSTSVLARELRWLPLHGRSVLDVGTGSGALALFAASLGARATALDINPAAVDTTSTNATANGLAVEAVQSDLWSALDERRFDLAVVNPPYFRRDPTTISEHAFYAGASFDYFARFFAGLGAHLAEGGRCLMVLGGHCDLRAITAIAANHGWALEAHRTAYRRLAPQVVYEVAATATR